MKFATGQNDIEQRQAVAENGVIRFPCLVSGDQSLQIADQTQFRVTGREQYRRVVVGIQRACETERQPECRHRVRSQAVEQAMRGNYHDVGWAQFDHALAKKNAMSAVPVVVQPPERAEHAGIVPVPIGGKIPGFVQCNSGAAGFDAKGVIFNADP